MKEGIFKERIPKEGIPKEGLPLIIKEGILEEGILKEGTPIKEGMSMEGKNPIASTAPERASNIDASA